MNADIPNSQKLKFIVSKLNNANKKKLLIIATAIANGEIDCFADYQRSRQKMTKEVLIEIIKSLTDEEIRNIIEDLHFLELKNDD